MKHLLDIPDLPMRAFVRHGRTIQPQGGGKGDAPATPDYKGAAEETAAGNLEMAKYATQANRANQYTPWGSLEWTNDRQFDQAGYDAAMKAYQDSLSGSSQGSGKTYSPMEIASDKARLSSGAMSEYDYNQKYGGDYTVSNGQKAVQPNRDDYYTGGDNWTQKITLSPEMQALFDQQNKLQQGLFGAQDAALGRVNDVMGQGFDTSTLPGLGEVYDPTKVTNNAAELLMARMNPELDRQNEALRAQLANQGITQGSAAYNNAMNTFGQQRNDAGLQAQLQAIQLGMQQQGQTYSQQNNNRQQELALQTYLRSLPLNELNALRTGNQVSQPNFPGYAQQATTGGADYLGAANQQYKADLSAANASSAQSGGVMGGILGVAGGIAGGMFGGPMGAAAGSRIGSGLGGMFSDRRLKRNIKLVGKADNGLNIYSYNYVWGGPVQLGHMADEVLKVAPHAVGERDGFMTVDYGKL